MKETTIKTLLKLVISGMMIGLGTVLSMIKIFEMPFGGSVTLLSMLPSVLVSVMCGTGWGLAAAFVSSLIQLFLSLSEVLSWGLTPVMLIGTMLLDYILPYTLLGFAGIFRKNGYMGVCAGTFLALILRFLSHFASGVILWANFEKFMAFGKEWIGHPVLYSICYNGAFMLPEIIITLLGTALIFGSSEIRRLCDIK